MKKLWIALILLMLCGCTKEPGREMIQSVDLDGNRMEVNVWEGLATDEH